MLSVATWTPPFIPTALIVPDDQGTLGHTMIMLGKSVRFFVPIFVELTYKSTLSQLV